MDRFIEGWSKMGSKLLASSYRIFVSYGQVAVFADDLDQPFNNWTEQQSMQGFSWRKNSVSFGTLMEFGEHQVDVVYVTKMPVVSSDAVRAIEVPFECPKSGKIEIASIGDEVALTMPSGNYSLRCELMAKALGEVYRVRFTFAKALPVALVRALSLVKGLNMS